MGCGIYLAWPAFYTDVTDAYRLGRRARLRTDLGGVYFNVIVVLITAGLYFATGFEPLLLLVVIQHFEIAHQLLPVVRLDGYYIISDLTGVPDLFARIGPILRSLNPLRPADERVTALKRWVRVAVTAWVFIVVPLLLFEMIVVLIHLPRIIGTAWDSGRDQISAAGTAFGDGQLLSGVGAVLQLIVLAIPVIGIVMMLVKLTTGAGRWGWQHTDGRPVRRTAFVLAAGGLAVLLAMAWLPGHNYTPIKPGERGTVGEGAVAVRRLPTGSGPLYSEQIAQQQGTETPTVAPAAADPTASPSDAATTSTVPSSSSSSSSSSSGATTTTAATSTTASSTSTTGTTTTTAPATTVP
jgi:putative peptide zinc metalloprotease protein